MSLTSLYDVSAAGATVLSTAGRVMSLTSLYDVSAAGATVRLAKQLRLLCVTVDAKLKFNSHDKNVCRAAFCHTRPLTLAAEEDGY